MKLVELFGQKVVVANTGKEIVAFGAACPHADGPLHEGRLRGRNIVCPLHAYIWNVYTGEPVEPAQEDILQRYPVRVDPVRGQVWVALAEPPD
jgi:nitrite reductase/ring-hydroxylating ferredoxin subunit